MLTEALILAFHPVVSALATILPLAAFLTAALTLAELADRSGLCSRGAALLVAATRGHVFALYALLCTLCCVLTAIVSLDGAVVVLVPLVRVLAREFRAPFAPLFLAVVVVANAFSFAVPQGNPTNLLVMRHADISTGRFVETMFVPGLVTTLACAGVVAFAERHELRRSTPLTAHRSPRWSRSEVRVLAALCTAGAASWLAPFLGLSPWWTFSTVAACLLVVSGERARPRIPWRLALELGGLLTLVHLLPISALDRPAHTLPALLGVALAASASSALLNNLPTSVAAQALLAATPAAYAACIGLGVGALATARGSVATVVARDLAGGSAPPLPAFKLAPLAVGGAVLATVMLWAAP